jgi:hypothetical protein
MIIIFESLFVGLYCLFLYTILENLNLNKYYFLFIFGFLKHYLSYYFGIHDYYCNNGYACASCASCTSCTSDNTNKISNTKYLLFDSILEGFLFIIVGHYILKIFVNRYLGFFVIGVFLHIFAELFFIHTYFCKHRCIEI